MDLLKTYNQLNDEYGEEWLDFEPETLRGTKYIGEGDELKFNGIMALQTALSSQADANGIYFTDWRIFEKVVLSLTGVIPDFTEIEHVEPHEIHYVFSLLKNLSGDVEFNSEVTDYIVAAYNTENLVYCPFYKKVDDKLKEDDLKKRVRELWERLPEDKPQEEVRKLENSPEAYQIRRLVYIEKYTEEMLKDA